MKNLMRMNPAKRQLRDQTLRVATASVAGPALMYAGYKFPGSATARGLLVLLGAAVSYAHWGVMQEARDEEEEPLAGFPEDFSEEDLSALTG